MTIAENAMNLRKDVDMQHELKTLPTHFQQTLDGNKPFTVRDNADRGFQKGDELILREFDENRIDDFFDGNEDSGYTGRAIKAQITYVSTHNQPQNQVVIGFTADLGGES